MIYINIPVPYISDLRSPDLLFKKLRVPAPQHLYYLALSGLRTKNHLVVGHVLNLLPKYEHSRT
jgi:hypothetical protein